MNRPHGVTSIWILLIGIVLSNGGCSTIRPSNSQMPSGFVDPATVESPQENSNSPIDETDKPQTPNFNSVSIPPAEFHLSDSPLPNPEEIRLASATEVVPTISPTRMDSPVRMDLSRGEMPRIEESPLQAKPAAKTAWFPLLNRKPDPFNSQFQRGRKLENEGKTLEAINEYEQIVQADSQHVQSLHRLGVLYAETDQFESANRCFQQATALDPANVELLCDCGFHHQVQGANTMAEFFYNNALGIAPNHKRAHNQLGVLLVQADNTNLALQHFRSAGLTKKQAQQNVTTTQLWKYAE